MTADDTSTGHTVAPDRDRSDPIDAEYTVIDVPAVSAAVEVRNVVGLSYTTSSTFIFPRRSARSAYTMGSDRRGSYVDIHV